MRRWGLRGATIAFVVLLALFLIGEYVDYFKHVDAFAEKIGYKKANGLSAGGRFTRDLALALLAFGGIGMAAWRNREMSRQADAARDQIDNESNRIAGERFSAAVKMLTQNNEKSKPATAARSGGVYALQSLANNYISEYAAQVVKTLVAYVRENAQLTRIKRKDLDLNFLGEDVKAAFAVLAQLLDERDESPEKRFELSDNDLDFSDCDFSRLCLGYRQVKGLQHYEWRGADLRGSDLHCADFRKARMDGAQLQGATLCGANLKDAHLYNADLRGANLEITKEFGRTNLQDADLLGADLRGAAFSGADLSRASLGAVKLQDTDLQGATLSGARGLPKLSSDQIWHSDDKPELEGVESIEMSSDRKWDLEPYRDCPYALAGVLRNYKIIYGCGIIPIPSRGLLKAARKLLDDNQLPPGFSEIWRKRLEEVDPETGDHPDWRE